MVHQNHTNHPTVPASLEDVFHWLLPADFPFTRHGNAVVEARILANVRLLENLDVRRGKRRDLAPLSG